MLIQSVLSPDSTYEVGMTQLVWLQVDQLLEYHFEEDMARLTQHCGKKVPGGRQTIMVSATLKDAVSLQTALHMP